MLVSPLPPPFLDTEFISSLRYKALCIVNFFVFWSICPSSSIFISRMVPSISLRELSRHLSPWFLLLSLVRRNFLDLLRQPFLIFSFISACSVLLLLLLLLFVSCELFTPVLIGDFFFLKSEISRTLLRILADLSITMVWIVLFVFCLFVCFFLFFFLSKLHFPQFLIQTFEDCSKDTKDN